MNLPIISCPNCKQPIELSEAVAGPLRAEMAREFGEKIKANENALAREREQIAKRERELLLEAQKLDQKLAERLAVERTALEKQQRAAAREELSQELSALKEDLAANKRALSEAHATELALRKERSILETEKAELELTVARRLDEERALIRTQALQQAADESALKLRDRDEQLAQLRKQVDEMKRKADQGSQQAQGETLEAELEDWLRVLFPGDQLESVAKGVAGADVLHLVRDAGGRDCGTILWESKRTKNWSDGWLPKLRDDQRSARAELAVLVSLALPKEITTFACKDGTWVTSLACARPLAAALRAQVLAIAETRLAGENQQGKMAELYAYMTSSAFRQRVEALAEAFTAMQSDLAEEKRAIGARWAKREKQLDRVLNSVTGMYGDILGIAGGEMKAIDALELKALAAGPDGQA